MGRYADIIKKLVGQVDPVTGVPYVSSMTPGDFATNNLSGDDIPEVVASKVEKLGTVVADIEKNQVQANWNQNDSTAPDYVKNRPSICAGQGRDSIVENTINNNFAEGDFSHAEGDSTAAEGVCSHAEGDSTAAKGDCSHAEGDSTAAEGDFSHAEGNSTAAEGVCSHAEGSSTDAKGDCSHAEGYYTAAEGECSHAEGNYTITQASHGHVSGAYNAVFPSWEANTAYKVGNVVAVKADVFRCKIEHTSSPNFSDKNWEKGGYGVIVGNGASDTARSNAYALDWEGNGHYMKDVYVNCEKDSTGGVALYDYIQKLEARIKALEDAKTSTDTPTT